MKIKKIEPVTNKQSYNKDKEKFKEKTTYKFFVPKSKNKGQHIDIEV